LGLTEICPLSFHKLVNELKDEREIYSTALKTLDFKSEMKISSGAGEQNTMTYRP